MLSGQVKRQKKGRNPAFIRFFEENPAENRSGGSQPENMESKISRLSERNQIAIYIGLGTFYTTPFFKALTNCLIWYFYKYVRKTNLQSGVKATYSG